MKNYAMALAVMLFLGGAISCEVESGYIETRPADVIFVRPASPGVGYVWISGDWVWSGNNYVWHEGYWSRSRSGRAYVNGSWDRSERGWRWHKGYWK